MSHIYIETQNVDPSSNTPREYFALTVTESVSLNMSSKPTRNPVSDKSVISDHVVNENKRFTFSGMVSNVINFGYQAEPPIPQFKAYDNLSRLVLLRESKTPFSIKFDKDLELVKNCVFTSLEFSKESGMGSSYNVNLSFEQLNIAPISQEFKDRMFKEELKKYKGLTDNGDSNTKKVPAQEVLVNQLIDLALKGKPEEIP
jgi:hypothetical protein